MEIARNPVLVVLAALCLLTAAGCGQKESAGPIPTAAPVPLTPQQQQAQDARAAGAAADAQKSAAARQAAGQAAGH